MRRFIALVLLVALPACATAPAGEDLAAYPAALVGAYDNSAQYAGAPDDLKRPPVPDGAYDWIDAQAVSFRSVSVPFLGPHVVYAEWRSPTAGVSRQELWSFRRDGDRVTLDTRTLAASAARMAAGTDGAAFASLTGVDMSSAEPGCALAVASNGRGAWNAQTDPDACKLMLPAGRVAVDTRITVMPTGVLYQTAGRLPDGSFVFRTPGGPPYDFRRRP